MRGRYVIFCVVFIHCVMFGVVSNTPHVRLCIGPRVD
jgi:hypothetical protein